MKTIIGITGGIASGKSLVSRYLISKDYFLLDCDLIVKKLLEKNNEGYLKIIKSFSNILTDKLEIDKLKLGNIIFNDEKERNKLNSIIHPIVKDELLKIITTVDIDLIFIDIPLLFESGFDDFCDKVILVYVNKDIQVDRLIKRDDISKIDALKKIESQMDIELKKEKSDYIIFNENDIIDTYNQIEKILSKIVKEKC